jgi:hypothetical protein
MQTSPLRVDMHYSTDQPDNTPTAKVTAGLLSGAMVVVLIGSFGRLGVDLTAEEAGALVVIFSGIASWFKRSRPGELDR